MRSVVTYVVRESSRLDGTAASASQRARVRHEMGDEAGTGVAAAPASAAPAGAPRACRAAQAAHAASRTITTPSVSFQSRRCRSRPNSGSSSTGYASSASMLPALLAA